MDKSYKNLFLPFLVVAIALAEDKAAPAALLASGKYEEARAALAGAKSAGDLANRCTANYKLKRWDSAIEDCTESLRLNPKQKKALSPQLSDAYYRRALAGGGAEDLYAAVRADRANPLPYIELGRRALAQKQSSVALKYLDRAIVADPGVAEAFELRSQANEALGRKKAAEGDAARAAKLSR